MTIQAAPGLLGVVLVTAGCFPLHLNYQIPSLLYLLVVVLHSIWAGYESAVIVCVVAAVCLEYFFIPPVLEWQIDDPEDALALLTYLAASLVVTHLASSARTQARIAETKRREAALLYESASRLLSLEPEFAAGIPALRIFREVFQLNAACLFDATVPELLVEGKPELKLADETRNAYFCGRDYRSADGLLHIRCLYSGWKLVGSVGFEGYFDEKASVFPLFALAATSFERTLSFRSASKSAAAAQAEILRSAILDAFAHEFKTPQAVIMAAAGSLREAGGLGTEQLEMADVIEGQISRMNRLTTRLLRLARIDREEIEPNLEATRLDTLLAHLVRECRTQSGEHIISYDPGPGEPIALVDPELMSLAVVQLLDNACKYSSPGSVVKVEISHDGEFADIRVMNEGCPIREEERERVFERFYRGVDTEQSASGAGLGLYVSRKIARAHGGHLELDRDPSGPRMTAFRLRLPTVKGETDYAGQSN